MNAAPIDRCTLDTGDRAPESRQEFPWQSAIVGRQESVPSERLVAVYERRDGAWIEFPAPLEYTFSRRSLLVMSGVAGDAGTVSPVALSSIRFIRPHMPYPGAWPGVDVWGSARLCLATGSTARNIALRDLLVEAVIEATGRTGVRAADSVSFAGGPSAEELAAERAPRSFLTRLRRRRDR